jgi:hypothetical protein
MDRPVQDLEQQKTPCAQQELAVPAQRILEFVNFAFVVSAVGSESGGVKRRQCRRRWRY